MKFTTDSDWLDDARTQWSHSGERAARRRPPGATLVWTAASDHVTQRGS